MLLHPIHRARSRQSTSSSTTTNPTSVDSLQSWSMAPGHSGSSTSVWSDDGATVLPSSEEGKSRFGLGEEGDGERPLIELDSDPEPGFGRIGREQVQGGQGKTPGTKPSEELRRLLRQMDEEVKSSIPASVPVQSQPHFSPIKRPTSLPALPPTRVRTPPVVENVSTRRANWKEGRRIGVYPPARDDSPEREEEGEEEEEESPPTPPVRLTNPYLHSTRKVSGEYRPLKVRMSVY